MHLLRESKKRQHWRWVSLGICAGILMQSLSKSWSHLLCYWVMGHRWSHIWHILPKAYKQWNRQPRLLRISASSSRKNCIHDNIALYSWTSLTGTRHGPLHWELAVDSATYLDILSAELQTFCHNNSLDFTDIVKMQWTHLIASLRTHPHHWDLQPSFSLVDSLLLTWVTIQMIMKFKSGYFSFSKVSWEI
jgi:hypothetical protein